MPYRSPRTVSSPVETPTNIRYWVLGGFCVAAAIAYTQRYGINLLVPYIQDEVGLDKDQMGVVMGGFFIGYAATQVPAGWLGDRWGARKALSLYALVWSFATALMGAAWDWASLVAIWTLAGAAQAGLFPCAVIGVRDWMPSTRRAVASGMLSTFMNVGAVCAPLLAGWLLVYYSWREAFVWLSILGIAWASWYFWWFRDSPADHPSVNDAERNLIAGGETASNAPGQKPSTPWLRLATSPRMWLICAQHFLRAAAQVFFGTWFGTFLLESGISQSEVALIASIPPALLITGSLVGGILSDWLLQSTGSRRIARQGLAVVNLLLCASMFAIAAGAQDAYLRVGLISAGCLFMTIGGVNAYAITMDVGGRHVATVFSTMNMCGSIGAAAFPVYVGKVLDATGNWDYILFSIAAIYIAAAACWALLNPNGTLFDEPPKP
ncbi:MAG: MFS transporter [Pirellulales bacterium]